MAFRYYPKSKAKYKNVKATYNGITFDSLKEMRRYKELLLLEKAGAIQDLQLQVKFELIPAQYESIETGEYYKRGTKKGQPKTKDICIEQSLVYVADFVYMEAGKKVVEDVKGYKEGSAYNIFKIKRKLALWIHGIKIKEV